MKFGNRKQQVWKKQVWALEEQENDTEAKRRKRERREKYKVKNQKYHQLNSQSDDEWDDAA